MELRLVGEQLHNYAILYLSHIMMRFILLLFIWAKFDANATCNSNGVSHR